MVDAINILSLCTGVGGLELGVRIAEPRARAVCMVEREAHAAAVLAQRMADGWLEACPIWMGDIGKFDPAPWRGVVDCVISGDPCQPNSVAGKRLGAADDRWLADRVLDIVAAIRPARFFRENVPGNADGQLAVFVPALERMGYRVAAGIFSAAEVGASHRRERLFIMADIEGRGLGERGYPPRPGRGGYADGGDQDMANAAGARRGAGQPSRRGSLRNNPRREGLDGPGGPLGNTEDHHGRSGVGTAQEGTRQDGIRRRRPATAGRLVADTRSGIADQSERQRPRPGDEEGGRPSGEPTGYDLCVAHADEPGSPERPHTSDGRGTLGKERQAPGARGDDILPIFAPGPSDPRWPDIIARAPHLEPAICRVADGMAHLLDNRIDRLRETGNGVVSLAAAYAWRTLGATLRAKS